jgi:hypothetical protein
MKIAKTMDYASNAVEELMPGVMVHKSEQQTIQNPNHLTPSSVVNHRQSNFVIIRTPWIRISSPRTPHSTQKDGCFSHYDDGFGLSPGRLCYRTPGSR